MKTLSMFMFIRMINFLVTHELTDGSVATKHRAHMYLSFHSCYIRGILYSKRNSITNFMLTKLLELIPNESFFIGFVCNQTFPNVEHKSSLKKGIKLKYLLSRGSDRKMDE